MLVSLQIRLEIIDEVLGVNISSIFLLLFILAAIHFFQIIIKTSKRYNIHTTYLSTEMNTF